MSSDFAAHVKYPLRKQLDILTHVSDQDPSRPFVVGRITHSHTEACDFLSFSKRGARILLLSSGITLHNIAVRSVIDTVAERPILLWQYGADKNLDYIIGEECEASVSGSDGVFINSSDLIAVTDAGGLVLKCRSKGFSIFVNVVEPAHLSLILTLNPDVVVTMDNVTIDRTILLNGQKDSDNEDRNNNNISHNSKSRHESNGNISSYPARKSASPTNKNAPFLLHLNTLRQPYIRSPDLMVCQPSNQPCGIILEDATLLDPVMSPTNSAWDNHPLVKVCGIRTLEAAQVAVESGADLVGMIMVPNRSRTVDLYEAKRICDYVHACRRRPLKNPFGQLGLEDHVSLFEVNSRITRARCSSRPMVVGVFQNQPLRDILTLVQELGLDIVQLHGSEPLEWCRVIPVPVIKRFTPNTSGFENASVPGYHYLSLLDGEVGGEGKLVDWSAIDTQVALGARFILAGGLNENNVADALKTKGVYGVDVSGGVETNGHKDMAKIQRFVEVSKTSRLI